MNSETNFTILLLHQIENYSIVQIYDYFDCAISKEYITELVNNADTDDIYFDNILINYLVC